MNQTASVQPRRPEWVIGNVPSGPTVLRVRQAAMVYLEPIHTVTISGIIRAAFKEAGMTPCAVLVIVGKSGMLKSHYVPHLVQLYRSQS